MGITSPLIVAIFTALGHAIYSFAIIIAALALVAYQGADALRDLIGKSVARVGDAWDWVHAHPVAFIFDLVAATAFAGYWLREFSRASPDLWLVDIAFSLSIFVSALVWWPLIIGPLLQYPVFIGIFVVAVLCSALSLHFLTMPEWIEKILFFVKMLGALVLFAPIVIGLFLIICLVVWGLLLAAGLAFRFLVAWIGLEGIAGLLQALGLVAIGLAEYFKFYGVTNFNLTEGDYGQLVYFGAFCGALGVGFSVLSVLSDKTRAWLGDTKKSHS